MSCTMCHGYGLVPRDFVCAHCTGANTTCYLCENIDKLWEECSYCVAHAAAAPGMSRGVGESEYLQAVTSQEC